MRRQLVLKKDTLTELTPRQLGQVAGGAEQSRDCIDPPSNVCIETYGVCLISRLMYPCLTEPSLNC